jgi:hypothetical protein
MATNRIHCVVVWNEPARNETAELWGVVSDLDLVKVAATGDLSARTSGESAATPPLTVAMASVSTSVARARETPPAGSVFPVLSSRALQHDHGARGGGPDALPRRRDAAFSAVHSVPARMEAPGARNTVVPRCNPREEARDGSDDA